MDCPACGTELTPGLSVGTGEMNFLPLDGPNGVQAQLRDESLAWRCPSCGLILVDRESPVPENEAVRDAKKSRSCMFRIGWALLGLTLLLILLAMDPELVVIAVQLVLQPFVCVAVLAIIGIPTYLVTRGLGKESESDPNEDTRLND